VVSRFFFHVAGHKRRRLVRRKPVDHAVWIPRREASKILQCSLATILSWSGPRFRVREDQDRYGRRAWYVHREDVERVRLERVGPAMHEIETFVLGALAEGKSATEIVRSGKRVTLSDIERIRDQEARLSDGCVVDGSTMRELRTLLGIDRIDARILLVEVRNIVTRIDGLVARLHAHTPDVHRDNPSPFPKPNGE
jgi:hypothetical protein